MPPESSTRSSLESVSLFLSLVFRAPSEFFTLRRSFVSLLYLPFVLRSVLPLLCPIVERKKKKKRNRNAGKFHGKFIRSSATRAFAREIHRRGTNSDAFRRRGGPFVRVDATRSFSSLENHPPFEATVLRHPVHPPRSPLHPTARQSTRTDHATRGQYLCTLLTGTWIYVRPLYYASCRPPCKAGMLVPSRARTQHVFRFNVSFQTSQI